MNAKETADIIISQVWTWPDGWRDQKLIDVIQKAIDDGKCEILSVFANELLNSDESLSSNMISEKFHNMIKEVKYVMTESEFIEKLKEVCPFVVGMLREKVDLSIIMDKCIIYLWTEEVEESDFTQLLRSKIKENKVKF